LIGYKIPRIGDREAGVQWSANLQQRGPINLRAAVADLAAGAMVKSAATATPAATATK